ncbi:hypothetical protein LPJ66_011860, partial [Kickxella alabastrina]
MQESEFDSVIWDTKIAGDHENEAPNASASTGTGSAAGLNNTSPLVNSTHTSPFSGLGSSSRESMDGSDLLSNSRFGSHSIGEASGYANRDTLGSANAYGSSTL